MFRAIFVTVFLFIGSVCSATVWEMHPDGSGDFATIQAAVDGAADGDTISFQVGTYSGPGNWDVTIVGRWLTLIGQGETSPYARVSANDGGVPHRPFYIANSQVEMVNLLIESGRADQGGLIYLASGALRVVNGYFIAGHATDKGGQVYAASGSDPEFRDSRFSAGFADNDGGAVYLDTGVDAYFEDCWFDGNDSDRVGGAVVARQNASIFFDCRFAANTAVQKGGAVMIDGAPGPTFDTCEFDRCDAQQGGAVAVQGENCAADLRLLNILNCEATLQGGAFYFSTRATPILYRCTIAENDAPEGGGIYADLQASLDVQNTIIAWNGSGGAFAQDGSVLVDFACTTIWNNVGGDWVNGLEVLLPYQNNMNEDPQFCNIYSNVGRGIATTSPCTEYNNPACGWIGSEGTTCSNPSYYVEGDGSGQFPTIQEAIDVAPEEASVKLIGEFSGPGNRDLVLGGKNLKIRSPAFAGARPVVDCGGSVGDPHRFLVIDGGQNVATAIQYVEIRNGHHDFGGGILVEGSSPKIEKVVFVDCVANNQGGAIAVLSDFEPWPVWVLECRFEGNHAPAGGAIFVSSESELRADDSVFEQNHATFGGAIFNGGGTLELDNCWFEGNSVNTYGGGIHFNTDGGSTVAGCTFLGNSANIGGGLSFRFGASPLFQYCTLAENSTSQIYVIENSAPQFENCIVSHSPSGAAVASVDGDTSQPAFSCSDIWGNMGGDWSGLIADQAGLDENFSADPLFCGLATGDLTLYDISPCLPASGPCLDQTGSQGQGCVDGVTAVGGLPAVRFFLADPVPNPFNPSVELSLDLPEAASVSLAVYDAAGRHLRTMLSGGHLSSGRHTLRWDGRDDSGRSASSGIYFFRAESGGEVVVRKGVLVR